jgi:sterol desaturase/sphingolipid hydroxylase (fatty acid hydroxylase superfamily)
MESVTEARRLPLWLTVPLALGGFLLFNWLERRRPLRKQTEPKLRREARNIGVSGMSAAALELTEISLVLALTRSVARRRWGILPHLPLPLWAELPAALLLMDYTYYLWHVLLHRARCFGGFTWCIMPTSNMDASSALRFHFGEVLLTCHGESARSC